MAAACPASSEICAFQPSTGSSARNESVQPSGPRSTSCSGIARLIPPRRASRSWRSSPTSRSSCSDSLAAAVVERALDAGVVELLAAAHERAADVDRDALAVTSTSIVQTSAGRSSSGKQRAAPSESCGG